MLSHANDLIGKTLDYPKNESYNTISLRSMIVSTPVSIKRHMRKLRKRKKRVKKKNEKVKIKK